MLVKRVNLKYDSLLKGQSNKDTIIKKFCYS